MDLTFLLIFAVHPLRVRIPPTNPIKKSPLPRRYFLWPARRATDAARPSASPTVALATVPGSPFTAKNSPPDCFLNAVHPLRVRIPPANPKKIIPASAEIFFWPARRDSNPRSSESESAALSGCATSGYIRNRRSNQYTVDSAFLFTYR